MFFKKTICQTHHHQYRKDEFRPIEDFVNKHMIPFLDRIDQSLTINSIPKNLNHPIIEFQFSDQQLLSNHTSSAMGYLCWNHWKLSWFICLSMLPSLFYVLLKVIQERLIGLQSIMYRNGLYPICYWSGQFVTHAVFAVFTSLLLLYVGGLSMPDLFGSMNQLFLFLAIYLYILVMIMVNFWMVCSFSPRFSIISFIGWIMSNLVEAYFSHNLTFFVSSINGLSMWIWVRLLIRFLRLVWFMVLPFHHFKRLLEINMIPGFSGHYISTSGGLVPFRGDSQPTIRHFIDNVDRTKHTVDSYMEFLWLVGNLVFYSGLTWYFDKQTFDYCRYGYGHHFWSRIQSFFSMDFVNRWTIKIPHRYQQRQQQSLQYHHLKKDTPSRMSRSPVFILNTSDGTSMDKDEDISVHIERQLAFSNSGKEKKRFDSSERIYA